MVENDTRVEQKECKKERIPKDKRKSSQICLQSSSDRRSKNEGTQSKKKKTLILRPIPEEDRHGHNEASNIFAYKMVFQRVHDDLKVMQIGDKSEGDHFKSP